MINFVELKKHFKLFMNFYYYRKQNKKQIFFIFIY